VSIELCKNDKEAEMVKKIAVVVLGIVICAAFSVIAQQPEKEKAAVAAAEKWLGMVDSGKYKESWQEASALFRNAVKQDQWEQAMVSSRNPLGKLISRKVSKTSFQTSLPGAPDGQYVVVQFETSFENKKSAVETVTPMLEKDGSWRVSGYYIK
jgi:hypothetical protein